MEPPHDDIDPRQEQPPSLSELREIRRIQSVLNVSEEAAKRALMLSRALKLPSAHELQARIDASLEAAVAAAVHDFRAELTSFAERTARTAAESLEKVSDVVANNHVTIRDQPESRFFVATTCILITAFFGVAFMGYSVGHDIGRRELTDAEEGHAPVTLSTTAERAESVLTEPAMADPAMPVSEEFETPSGHEPIEYDSDGQPFFRRTRRPEPLKPDPNH